MVLMRGWHLSQPVLDHRVHLTHRKKDASSELVLVVDLEPIVQVFSDLWLEDLRDWQLCEALLLDNVVVIFGLHRRSELLGIGCRRLHLPEVLLDRVWIAHFKINVFRRMRALSYACFNIFEAFQTS